MPFSAKQGSPDADEKAVPVNGIDRVKLSWEI